MQIEQEAHQHARASDNRHRRMQMHGADAATVLAHFPLDRHDISFSVASHSRAASAGTGMHGRGMPGRRGRLRFNIECSGYAGTVNKAEHSLLRIAHVPIARAYPMNTGGGKVLLWYGDPITLKISPHPSSVVI